jgi:putative transposase
MTQIWIALITMLLLAYMKFLAKLDHSITQIQRLLQLNLFKRQSLWELFDPPPKEYKIENRQKMLFDFS